LLTINKIIRDSFNDEDMPEEIRKIIAKFLEVEDTFSKGDSKDKMYEQILKLTLEKTENAQREKMLKWCDEY
jgi:hypothetical protein